MGKLILESPRHFEEIATCRMGWIEAGITGTFWIKLSQRCESFKDLRTEGAKAVCEGCAQRVAFVRMRVC